MAERYNRNQIPSLPFEVRAVAKPAGRLKDLTTYDSVVIEFLAPNRRLVTPTVAQGSTVLGALPNQAFFNFGTESLFNLSGRWYARIKATEGNKEDYSIPVAFQVYEQWQ